MRVQTPTYGNTPFFFGYAQRKTGMREKKGINYTTFGAPMPGRSYTSSSYRYGFNGKEKIDEVTGNTGTDYDLGLRIYDSRLARFMSVDPKSTIYSWQSPYAYFKNQPILTLDINGAGGEEPGTNGPVSAPQIREQFNDGKVAVNYQVTIYLDMPVTGSPAILLFPMDVGHAFISLTKINKDGTQVQAIYGWYPNHEGQKIPTGTPTAETNCGPGVFQDNSGHPSDVSVTDYLITEDQFNSILNTTDQFASTQYCLAGNNCTDFVEAVAVNANIVLPSGSDFLNLTSLQTRAVTSVPIEAPGKLGYNLQTQGLPTGENGQPANDLSVQLNNYSITPYTNSIAPGAGPAVNITLARDQILTQTPQQPPTSSAPAPSPR